MGKLADVRTFIGSNKDLDRSELVKQIAEKFGIKANTANMYVYKSFKILGIAVDNSAVAKATRKAKAVKAVDLNKVVEVVNKVNVKANNLAKLKEVSASRPKVDTSKVREELAAYEAELEEYSNSQPDYMKEFLGIAPSRKAAKAAAE